ncbi:MAG: hypothetical protein Aurels2KO_04640 [Aureliella sp.]
MSTSKPVPSRHKDSSSVRAAASKAAAGRALGATSATAEACERRLVLSAQLLMDVMADQALQMHGQLQGDAPDEQHDSCSASEFATAEVDIAGFDASNFGASQSLGSNRVPSTLGMPIESHLREAHEATGWNEVQNSYGLTGKGQTVAVIDSGIAWDHMALGEGFGSGYRVVGGWDFTEENDSQPYDDGPFGFHGTHVSGIIGSDDATHPGVAPEVDLVALRVFNDAGQGQMAWVEQALSWVHDNQDTFENPITTVNLSLGTSWNDDNVPSWGSLEDELQALYEDGIFVTASAGNSFTEYNAPGLSYPAASPYVLPVASVDDDGGLSDFSQRHERALAAPGGNILSTVPDHILGSDGVHNDFSTASGTSMAAPYVAGSAVLVRQAMEMLGVSDINLETISEHLRETSDSFFDSATGASYDRLNLESALDALIPNDAVGDQGSSAAAINLNESLHTGWINTLADTDVYSFTADASGTLSLSTDSEWIDSLSWTIQSGGQTIADSSSAATASLTAGTQYEIVVSANQEIGPYDLGVNFQASSSGSPPASGSPPPSVPPTSGAVDLGSIDYYSDQLSGGNYEVTAVRDGTMTLQWALPSGGGNAGGSLTAISGATNVSDGDISDGFLRVDLQVQAGQSVQFALPAGAAAGELTIANVLSATGNSAVVSGTSGGDQLAIDLSAGKNFSFGDVEYDLAQLGVTSLTVDSAGGADSLEMQGSSGSDKVDLRPGLTTIESAGFSATVVSTEDVHYNSGGGPDRVYLYDSDGDDTLRANPRSAELTGVGYRYSVEDVDRIFIHATGGGQDFAYLYDSAGDDRLSMRPQFASLQGDDFFNYVRGFERVYAYATAGGTDEALLYDSGSDDRFSTSGETASIVGPGFSSFSRSFESVQAIAEAGGTDRATLYGGDAGVRWQQGSDFVSMEDGDLQREARGFGSVETYVAGSAHSVGTLADQVPAVQSQQVSPEFSIHNDASAPSPVEIAAGYGVESAPSPDATPSILPTSVDSGDNELLQEQEILDTVRSLSDWVTSSDASHDRRMDLFDLPDERLLIDEDFSNDHLDEVFRQFDRNN